MEFRLSGWPLQFQVLGLGGLHVIWPGLAELGRDDKGVVCVSACKVRV